MVRVLIVTILVIVVVIFKLRTKLSVAVEVMVVVVRSLCVRKLKPLCQLQGSCRNSVGYGPFVTIRGYLGAMR
jgi:hypothetical protein